LKTGIVVAGSAILLLLTMPTIFAVAQVEKPQLGTIQVTKSIAKTTLDNQVTLLVTVLNNGTIPVFDIEVYEYLNPSLQAHGNATITQPSGQSQIPISGGTVATAVQVIIDPPPPNTLSPRQQLTIEYTQRAPDSGDFRIPASLAWYSFQRGGTTIRLNIYSNGLILHVPNGIEKAVAIIYPYVLAATGLVVTVTILIWARDKLSNSKKRRLFYK